MTFFEKTMGETPLKESELSRKAEPNALEGKTFEEVLEKVREAVSFGFEKVFGDITLEDAMLAATAKNPRSALICADYYLYHSYALKVIKAAAKLDPEFALRYADRYTRDPSIATDVFLMISNEYPKVLEGFFADSRADNYIKNRIIALLEYAGVDTKLYSKLAA